MGMLMPMAFAATSLVSFDTAAQEQLYRELLEEYRCLKCQNQNLADSNAALAGDLRNEIRDQVKAGQTRSEIDQYLIARYGDFVLYRPRLKSSTIILWFGPLVLLILASWYASRVINDHRREIKNSASTETYNQKLMTARSLLDKND